MKKQHYFTSPVIAASGMMGFFGKGYFYSRIFKLLFPILYSWRWIVFHSKTILAQARKGNMKLHGPEKDFEPVEFKPNCIYADPINGVGVNNVSLSNPGIKAYLRAGKLQKLKGEIHINFMLVGTTKEERMEEIELITRQLEKYLPTFKASKLYLRWNMSCPNTEHNALANFVESFEDEYAIISSLKLPIIIKVAYNFPYELAKKLQGYEHIFGFEAINTIPFDELSDSEKKEYFEEKYVKTGRDTFKVTYPSPLEKEQYRFNVKGNGGVSGNPIRKYALAWIKGAREHGITKPIIGGGGILWPWHVYQFRDAGANAISLGSISFLRPFCLLVCVLTAKFAFRKGH